MPKAPKFRRRKVVELLPTCLVSAGAMDEYLKHLEAPSAEQFRTAVGEAWQRYRTLENRWMKLSIKISIDTMHGAAADVVQVRKKAALEKEAEHRMDDVVWLVGGLLGRYDSVSNRRALEKMRELLAAAAQRGKTARKG